MVCELEYMNMSPPPTPPIIEFVTPLSKLINRDHRTVKRFIENSNKVRGRSDKGKFRKITRREVSSVKRTLSKNPHSTSIKIFHKDRVPLRSKAARCKILRIIGRIAKQTIKPLLKQRHKLAQLFENYIISKMFYLLIFLKRF